jgi:LL-H family phage holin
MHDFIQPYLNDVVSALVSLVSAAIVAFILWLRKKVTAYIDAHTTASQRLLLHTVAGEAVAYAGTVFKEQNGEQKLSKALAYVNDHLHTSFTEAELRGAVEKAYADYTKPPVSPEVPDAPTTVEAPIAPVEPEPVSAFYIAPAPTTAQGGA